MQIGVLRVEIHMGECRSLKDKRRILRRIKDKLRNSFNVSVAEIGYLDKWQRAALGIVTISNDKKHLSESLDKIVNFIEGENGIMVLDRSTELL